jgi:hypothetical protein
MRGHQPSIRVLHSARPLERRSTSGGHAGAPYRASGPPLLANVRGRLLRPTSRFLGNEEWRTTPFWAASTLVLPVPLIGASYRRERAAPR